MRDGIGYLFFLMDHVEARILDPNDNFMGWNDAKLERDAALFSQALWSLDIDPPTLEELLADFHSRDRGNLQRRPAPEAAEKIG